MVIGLVNPGSDGGALRWCKGLVYLLLETRYLFEDMQTALAYSALVVLKSLIRAFCRLRRADN